MVDQRYVDGIPVNRFFGFRLVAAGPDGATFELPARAEFAQEASVIQGGVPTALADVTAAYAIWPHRPPDTTMLGIEFKMNFLRPAKIGGEPVQAHGRKVHAGRRTGVAQVEIVQAGRPVALGTFTFFFFVPEV